MSLKDQTGLSSVRKEPGSLWVSDCSNHTKVAAERGSTFESRCSHIYMEWTIPSLQVPIYLQLKSIGYLSYIKVNSQKYFEITFQLNNTRYITRGWTSRWTRWWGRRSFSTLATCAWTSRSQHWWVRRLVSLSFHHLQQRSCCNLVLSHHLVQWHAGLLHQVIDCFLIIWAGFSWWNKDLF